MYLNEEYWTRKIFKKSRYVFPIFSQRYALSFKNKRKKRKIQFHIFNTIKTHYFKQFICIITTQSYGMK